MKMGLIIKFGGSLLFNDDSLDINKSKVMELIKIIQSSQNVQGIVCGGGKIARKYIQAGREMGFDEEKLDQLGIMVSRTNAQTLIYAMGENAYSTPIANLEDARQARKKKQLFVAGGFVPKQSTTTVAMQLCEILECDLIILTDVDGIYNNDPKTNPDAKKFETISYSELESLLRTRTDQERTAGKYQIFDLLSLEILKRSKLRVRFINGLELGNLQCLLTEDFHASKIGTIITP
ncbi:MAG: UMP kinase [Promethearchaeota archaeon]|nr:MAG: UMP kinase [Candidatus Lokiarchaeota archaeon]